MLSRRKWNGTNHGPGIKQGGLSAGSMHHSQRPEPSESDAPSRIFAQSSVPRIDRERGVAACGCMRDGRSLQVFVVSSTYQQAGTPLPGFAWDKTRGALLSESCCSRKVQRSL